MGSDDVGGIIAVLLAAECLEVGLKTVSKAAMSKGMSNFVFVVYANSVALLFLLPLAFTFHRIIKKSPPPPKITFSMICRILLLALIRYYRILVLITALQQCPLRLPIAYTFILAILVGMEKVDMKMKSCQAKCIGTIISIGGALVVTLYQGPTIVPFKYSSISHGDRDQLLLPDHFLPPHWIVGGSILALACLVKSIMYIVQTWIMKDYPAEVMVSLINCIFVTIISAIIAMIAEGNSNAWNLRTNIELVAIGYSAIYGVTILCVAHMWALRLKGPVFIAMFMPLEMVIAVAMGITFLGEALHIGSVIGIVIIAVGFYSVMWGKAKEEKIVDVGRISNFAAASDDDVPLLQSRSMDV